MKATQDSKTGRRQQEGRCLARVPRRHGIGERFCGIGTRNSDLCRKHERRLAMANFTCQEY